MNIYENIYINTLLKRRIILTPEFINKNFEENLKNILISQVGDKCIKEGYVDSNSIKIMKRNIGKTMDQNFSGNIIFDIVYTANICNPMEGNIINCSVDKINKLGILANLPPLSIVIAKQYHNNKELFKNLKIGDKIKVVVVDKRYALNGNVIEVIARLYDDVITKSRGNKKGKIKINTIKPAVEEPLIKEGDIAEDVDILEDISQQEEFTETEEEETEDVENIRENIQRGENEGEDEEEEDETLMSGGICDEENIIDSDVLPEDDPNDDTNADNLENEEEDDLDDNLDNDFDDDADDEE